MQAYGYDFVHFGLLMCFNLTIGVLTPPVGTCLYTTAMATKVPVDRMVKRNLAMDWRSCGMSFNMHLWIWYWQSRACWVIQVNINMNGGLI